VDAGRAQPRSARVYQDWATLLGTSSPIWHLRSCTVDEFLDLVCDHHKVSRDALAARAGIVVAVQPEASEPGSVDVLPERHLVGAYAGYSHACSPYSQGKVIRGSLAIEPAADGAPALAAIYRETLAFGPFQVRGPVSIANRAVHSELLDATARFRFFMCLFLPGVLANVLAGGPSAVGDGSHQPPARLQPG
jgi:hypothetical protein